jgi:hypothetical protein
MKAKEGNTAEIRRLIDKGVKIDATDEVAGNIILNKNSVVHN